MKRSILFLSLFLLSLIVLTSSASAASWNQIQEVDVEVRNESWVQIQQVEVNIKPAQWYQIQVVEVELEQAQWVLVQTVEVELKIEQWVLVQTVEVELEQAEWSLIQTVEVELQQGQWVLVQTVEVEVEVESEEEQWVLIQTVEVNIVIPSGLLVWTGAGADNLASNPENWNEGIAPYNGIDVVFDSTSVKNCIWDIDASLVTVNSLTLANGYTGTLTQGDVDIGIGAGGYMQKDGLFVPYISKTVIFGGDVTFGVPDGISLNKMNAVFTEGEHRVSITGNNRLNTIVNYGIIHSEGSDLFVRSWHESHNYGELHLMNRLRTYAANVPDMIYTFEGKYYGQGNIYIATKVDYYIRMLDADIRVPLIISNEDSRSTSKGTLLTPLILESLLSIRSGGEGIQTLDINGHSLTVNGITVGMGGAIVGEGDINNAGDLESSLGLFDFKGQYNQTGNGKITLAQGQSINDLTVYVPVSLILGSDITVQGELIGIKNIVLNGYRLYFNGVTHLGEYPSEFYVFETVFIPIKTPVREALYVYGDIPRWMKYDSQKGGLYGVPVGIGMHDFNITCYSEYTDLVNLRVSFAVLEQTIQKDDFRGQSIGSIISIILSIIVIGMCGITRGPDGKLEYQISNVLLGGAVVVSVLVFASVIPSYGLVIVAFLLFAIYWGGRR